MIESAATHIVVTAATASITKIRSFNCVVPSTPVILTCSPTTGTSTTIVPPNSTSMQMFRVATGLFLSLATPRLISRLTFTHGLAHRAARRLAHALDRADGAGNIQSVASCQVARQVTGSVPLSAAPNKRSVYRKSTMQL